MSPSSNLTISIQPLNSDILTASAQALYPLLRMSYGLDLAFWTVAKIVYFTGIQ